MTTTTEDLPAKAVPVDAIIEKYIALRDLKATKTAAHKKDLETIEAGLDRCEAFLLGTLQSMGVESIKSSLGTVYTTTRTTAGVADWDAILPWIQEHEHWAMLEKRVNKTFVESYRNEHNDLPPGINWREDRTVNVRRV